MKYFFLLGMILMCLYYSLNGMEMEPINLINKAKELSQNLNTQMVQLSLMQALMSNNWQVRKQRKNDHIIISFKSLNQKIEYQMENTVACNFFEQFLATTPFDLDELRAIVCEVKKIDVKQAVNLAILFQSQHLCRNNFLTFDEYDKKIIPTLKRTLKTGDKKLGARYTKTIREIVTPHKTDLHHFPDELAQALIIGHKTNPKMDQ